MFYDKFKDLCDQKGVSCNKAATDIGLSNATPTTWKNRGITPKGDTLARIAEYFSVTTDYLLDKEQKEKAPTNEGEREIEDGAPDENYIILARNAKKLSPENRKQLLDMARIMFKEEFKD